FHEAAVGRLAAFSPPRHGHEYALAIKSCDEALDYAPGLSTLGLRLARRCWPGPLALSVDVSGVDSLVQRLPESVRKLLLSHSRLNLRVPGHAILQGVLKLAPAPLLLAEVPHPEGAGPTTAQEVVRLVGDHVQLVLDQGPARIQQPPSVVRLNGAAYEILRPGAFTDDNLRRLSSLMLVFVCTGNTCRSPMAEVLMRKRIADRIGCPPEQLEERGVWVLSAGVAAMSGGRASPEADTAVSNWGMRLIHHESQPVSERMVRFADLILAMTRGHREALLSQWPDASGRVHLLTRGKGDVSDPIGGPEELYQRCAEQIDSHLASWVEELDLSQLPGADAGPRPPRDDASPESPRRT
ncbi:MAG TPA: Sua5/YciO/YrdC/YwlC family protein, partial [Pirellulaceae bacterium]|nr:Sua5/YciO/YrdC/YwlC family protein [Pirellulaceae bacterium]